MSTKSKITFDTGIKNFEINGNAILKFNPSDPNLYARFKKMTNEITLIESEFNAQREKIDDAGETIDLLESYDSKIKQLLNFVFGDFNSFDSIFEGVNVMAISSNGEMIISNFLNAIYPIIEDGARKYAKLEAKKLIAKSSNN